MNVKDLITAVVAGVIVFAWGMTSWMVLPFHKASIEKLNAAPIAVEAIKKAAPESGMYAYPSMDASKEEMSKTPHILVATNYKEKKMPICMGIGLLINFLGALVLMCLIKKSGVTSIGDRLKIVCKAVFFATIVGLLPNWLYWGFTPMYTLLAFVDLAISWGIAGFWISKRV